MNPWSLPKDRSIKKLLYSLHQRLGEGHFTVPGCHEDARAITLCKPDEPDIRAYIYAYAQKPGRYGLHLEFPTVDTLATPTEIVEDLPLPRLQALLEAHFDILPDTEAHP